MEGLSSASRRTYSSAQRKFLRFCIQLGRVNQQGCPCPADEWTLCLFSTFLAQSLKYSSIKVYLSAVRSLHIDSGFADPLHNCLRLQRVVRGIKRVQGSSVDKRMPVTSDIMMIIFRSMDFHIFDDIMFWSACTLAYFGFLRASEFTTPSRSTFNSSFNLTLQDVAFDSRVQPSCVRVHLKASKTDPFRKGCDIFIGRGSGHLCAVSALVQYLSLRGNATGPLFLRSDGSPLSRSSLTNRLKDIVSAAGINGQYSSHSFRIGAATMAARNGIPDHQIQSLGRWTSSAYQSYIRPSPVELSALTKLLL